MCVRWTRRRAARVTGRAAVWIGTALLSGCALPAKTQPVTMRDDIIAVRQYYEGEPWIRDEEGRVTGIRTRAYFVAAVKDGETPKGVFVPGTIQASLHVLTTRQDGTSARELVYQWTFDPQQAAALRVMKSSKMGDSYGLFLRWPPELDLMGREVQIALSYQKLDGESVARRGSRFRVPVPTGWTAPLPAAATSQPRTPQGTH